MSPASKRSGTNRKDGRAPPLGELEDITEIAPFEAKVVKETETDYTTYALIAGAAVGLYVATTMGAM